MNSSSYLLQHHMTAKGSVNIFNTKDIQTGEARIYLTPPQAFAYCA